MPWSCRPAAACGDDAEGNGPRLLSYQKEARAASPVNVHLQCRWIAWAHLETVMHTFLQEVSYSLERAFCSRLKLTVTMQPTRFGFEFRDSCRALYVASSWHEWARVSTQLTGGCGQTSQRTYAYGWGWLRTGQAPKSAPTETAGCPCSRTQQRPWSRPAGPWAWRHNPLPLGGMGAEITGAGAGDGVRLARRERALMLGGLVGGPLSILLYTPLRNAITLGAKDGRSSAMQLYRQSVTPRLAIGWTGAVAPTVMSAPQFVAMGPLYHLFAGAVGPSLAIFPTALTESAISFGSQCRNAQRAYNVSVEPQLRVALQHPLNPVHRGFAAHVARNCFAMSGIRVFSPLTTGLVAKVRGGRQPSAGAKFTADFLASVIAAALSMPANQLFNFFAVSPTAGRHGETVIQSAAKFLRSQYLVNDAHGRARLSRLALRDVGMRCAYIAPQLTTFVTVERLFVRWADADADGGCLNP